MSVAKQRRISIVVFIDAMGWEVLKGRSFLARELPYRRKLRSVLGYSSACVPSILTGLMPREHGHWSFFYYSPETSPFKPLRALNLLPGGLVNRGRVRNLLSRAVKKAYGFTGYFQLYNVPFRYIHLFDYCEKRDIFKPGGMNRGKNIFECLEQAGVRYHVSDWHLGEEENFSRLHRDIERGEVTFAFLYLAQLDALLHRVGKESDKVDQKLAEYEQALRKVLAHAARHYEDVRMFICSDHGMATVHTHVDLIGKVEALGLEYGRDYVAAYDSTMGRFWFHNEHARERIRALLADIPEGRILSDQELHALGCDFDHHQFGELIFLMDAGVIIVPSHMGEKPITGMHGYHPDAPDSDASLLSNVEPPCDPKAIPDMFRLMRHEAGI
ncbi:MAG: nucleotide pyrophosphatase [Zetaproteobacteria bacterium]|nr:MAG: nucleotide pyrophosphatase [Zetaproteobacteria bacterium]